MAKKEMKYAQAFDELSKIVDSIEQEEVDVDDLGDKVKKALILLKVCKTKLHNTEEEVHKILEELDEL
jgi:exodeoxyribonuclease VII small subunit